MGRVTRVYNFQFLITFLVMAAAATRGNNWPPVPDPTLSVGFYSSRCRNVESIVTSVVESHYRADRTIAPGILRLHFHDCFMRGCDGSVLIAGNNTQKTAPPNLTLRGFDVIDDAKTQLETVCPGVVSCADIIALATRDAVGLAGGPRWAVPLGRRDGTISLASDADDLPVPIDSIAVQKQKFAAKNLNTQDLVVLAGGHTIGTAGCGLISYRVFNFNNTGKPDPSIDPKFVPVIQALCPLNGDKAKRVALDTDGQFDFDTSFFHNVRSGRGILQSDQVLWDETETRTVLELFVGLRQPAELRFGIEFVRSMIKMSLIGVKTGIVGEIRRVCSVVN